MSKNIIIHLIIGLLVYGCSADAGRKQDVSEYPSSRYMTATGLGQSESEARNQAIVEMSRIFDSRVMSETYDRIKSVIDASGAETFQQDIESNLRVVSEVELKGVEIVKTWFDEEKSTYYALAVLDRYKARDNWTKEIEDLDSMIEGESAVLNSTKSMFMRLQTVKKILNHWIEREVIVSRLLVLGFKQTQPATYDMKSVFYMIPQIKNKMLIFVNIKGEYAHDVEDRISELLSKAGFVMSDMKNGPDVAITGTVEVKPVDLKNEDWKFARAKASLTITDTETGSIVGEVSDNRRAGHLTYDEAVHKAVKKVSRTLSEKLVAYFEE